MKVLDKSEIIDQIAFDLGNSIFLGEEVDITARHIYKTYVEPLKLVIESEQWFSKKDLIEFILYTEEPKNYGLTTPEILSKWLKERSKS